METEELIVRRFQPEDWQDLYEYLSDEEVVKFEPYGVMTELECQRETNRRVTDPSFWAVYLKNCHKVIGNIYFAKEDFLTWELGYVFNSHFQGKGFATMAAHLVIQNQLKQGDIHRIIAMCDPKNRPSWQLLERIGMRREGHKISNVYFELDEKGQPIWKDTYEYGILIREYTASHSG
ncbi:GNAT family N-acetyltransferase [Vagococcus sp. BWB3-3]|uniref:GNAT family N-acetyltransferase n=1 Tax=Vagococcus allomyrinae TaxID=2794353 RepID=A0A940SXZ2_9ENTE|nr:GNAT family N-acetyltransferase [Vagococcus allomyrinae]